MRSEDKGCVLILLYPQLSHALYLDAGSAEKKDYTNIKGVLDDALNGLAYRHGPLRKPNRRQGKCIFGHKTVFPSMKKPAGSPRDAYYAILHMRAIVRDQERLMLPEGLTKWREDLANADDAKVRQEIYRIQLQIADIICNDVIKREGIFFNGWALPSNEVIKGRLEQQGDFRPFTYDGIHAFPPTKEDVSKKKSKK